MALTPENDKQHSALADGPKPVIIQVVAVNIKPALSGSGCDKDSLAADRVGWEHRLSVRQTAVCHRFEYRGSPQ
jgi:hypothetical protein